VKKSSNNVNKYSCIRIGPRCNVKCKLLSTPQSGEVIWTSCTLRYLRVYIDASRSFSCSMYNLKNPSIVHLIVSVEKLEA